jgi:transposase-like protein
MSKNRRKFSSEEKVKILHRHLVEKVEVSNLCDEYNLHPNVLYRWQKEFFEKGAIVFEKQSKATVNKGHRRIMELEDKLSKKDEVIAEIMESHVELKKKLGHS